MHPHVTQHYIENIPKKRSKRYPEAMASNSCNRHCLLIVDRRSCRKDWLGNSECSPRDLTRAAREQPASDFDLCNSNTGPRGIPSPSSPPHPLQDELSPLRSLCPPGPSLCLPRSSPAQRLRRGRERQDQAFPGPSSPGTPDPVVPSLHTYMLS